MERNLIMGNMEYTSGFKFYPCEGCGGEGLVFEVNNFFEEGDVCIALYSIGQYGKQKRFKERLKWCWRILKTGFPWCDQIIFTLPKAKDFAKSILEEIDKCENILKIAKEE